METYRRGIMDIIAGIFELIGALGRAIIEEERHITENDFQGN